MLDGEEVVGFVSANFDPDGPVDHFRSVLWRINVDADDQGRGVGRFAVEGAHRGGAQPRRWTTSA